MIIKRLKAIVTGGTLALMCVSLGFGFGAAALRVAQVTVHAQSTRRGGVDVPVTPFEQWFKRLGLLNTNGGCDIALEYNAANQARFTDCTDAANLRDVQMRNLTSTGYELLGGTSPGGALTDYSIAKEVTAIADATFTDLFTVTVPNAAHAATIPLFLTGRLGAGGAIGADECVATAYGQIVIARTAGVATVATATALASTGSSCVVGATTIALAYQVSAMTGATSVAQTFTIQGRITKGGGASAAHKIDAVVDVINSNAAGITIS